MIKQLSNIALYLGYAYTVCAAPAVVHTSCLRYVGGINPPVLIPVHDGSVGGAHTPGGGSTGENALIVV